MLSIFLANSQSLYITMIIIWVIVIAVAIILESQTSELVSIWFGAGAIAGIVCALMGLSPVWQCVAFASLSIILVIVTRPLAKKLTSKTEVKTNVDKLIGMVAIVTEEIPFEGKGTVKVDYREWTAVTDKKTGFTVGEHVVIKDIIGNKLLVNDIEEIEIK